MSNKNKNKINNPHDKYFRASMHDMRVAKEFLEFHLSESIKTKIDFSSLKTSSDTFVDEDLKLSQSDVVIHALINNTPAILYILAEHQSTIDPLMPFRILKYMIKIWEHYKNQRADKTGKLVFPVIVPIVFYTGSTTPYTGALSMWELCGDNANLMHEILSNPFNLIDVNTISDEALKEKKYLGTMEHLMRAKFRQQMKEELELVMRDFLTFFIDPNDTFLLKSLKYIIIINEEHKSITALLDEIQKSASETIRSNIMGLAARIESKGFKLGIEKGREGGREEEKYLIAKNMLLENSDARFVAKVTGLSLDEIAKIKSEIHKSIK